MKKLSPTLIATALFGTLSLGLTPGAHADLQTDGGFASFTGTAPGAGTDTSLAASTLSDWVNNTQVSGASGYNGGLGYNFVYTPDAGGDFNYSGDHLPLWNTSNSGSGSITEPTGYAGNIIGADGTYHQGPLSQTITGLTIGDEYTVSFYYAGAQQLGFSGPTTAAWTVGFGDASQETTALSNSSKGFTGWTDEFLTFTADATSDELSFLAVGTSNGQQAFSLLADVVVTADAPEPTPLTYGALGLLLFGVRSLRKLRQQPPV